MKSVLAAGLSAFALLCGGCLSGSGDSGPTPQGVRREIGPYRAEGNRIIIAERIESRVLCEAAYPEAPPRLVTKPDTLAADTTVFELSGDSLILLNDDVDTLASGATLLRITNYSRLGSGSGLKGLWGAVSVGYRVLSGIPAADEKLE